MRTILYHIALIITSSGAIAQIALTPIHVIISILVQVNGSLLWMLLVLMFSGTKYEVLTQERCTPWTIVGWQSSGCWR